jgi:hypothetical protein
VTGLPTPHVLLDDGTGTFPIDITTKVRLPDAITRTLGRGDELSTIQPGTLALVCDYDATLAGQLVLDRQIRITYNGVTRGTWYVRAKPVSWPEGGDEYAVITLTCVDAWSNFASITLGSAFDEEILTDADTLVGYYPLTGGSDTTTEYDASGFGGPRLVIESNGGPVPAWGDEYGSSDGTTGVRFTQHGGFNLAHDSSYINALVSSAQNTWSGSQLHAEFVFSANSGLGPMSLLQVGTFEIDLSGGVISISGAGGTFGSGLNDNKPHVVSVEATTGGTFQVWIDGVNVGSGATPSVVFTNLIVQVGDNVETGLISGPNVTYAVGRVNIGSAILSNARIQAHHLAALSDCAGETPAQRYTRVCAYAGVATGTTDTNGATVHGPAQQAGKSLADVLNETALAALGIVYVDALGAVSSLNGYSMVGSATPTLSLDANWAAEDTRIEDDLARLLNSVTGQATGSPNVIPARNQASIDTHGRYTQDFSWNVSTDDQAFQLTWWEVNNYANPGPRAPALKIDLLTLDSTNLAIALTLGLGSYLRVTTMPSQTPSGTTLDLVIEGVTETLSDSEWSLSLTCIGRDAFGAWILGDSVWGVLDSTTKLFA